MTPKEVVQKIVADDNFNASSLNQNERTLLDRIAHKIGNSIDIVGKDRILLGELYKKLYREWPYEDGPEDVERRQVNARQLLETFDQAIESGILSLKPDQHDFIHRMARFAEMNKIIEKKDFNFLFYLSKQYEKELQMFQPRKKA